MTFKHVWTHIDPTSIEPEVWHTDVFDAETWKEARAVASRTVSRHSTGATMHLYRMEEGT